MTLVPSDSETAPSAAPVPPLERKDAWVALAIFAAALAAFTVGLGDLALWSRDETTYARISQEMLRTGDWLTLRYGGVNWFCHPPLYFWLVAATLRLVEPAELAVRLPSAVFGAGGVVLAWLWGRSLFSARAGVLAAACMGINLQYFGQSRLCIIDTTFLFFVSLSMLCFWWGTRGSRAAWYGMFLAAGLACLAKGPYGLLFPFAVGVPYLVLIRRLDRLREVPWGPGMVLALAVGGAWYVAEIALWGQAFVSQVLGYYFIGRFTTQVLRQGGPFWFYVPVLLVGWFPWSLLLPAAMVAAWKSWRASTRGGGDVEADAQALPLPAAVVAAWKRWRASARGGGDGQADALALLVVWLVLVFVGLSVARTKLPNYIFFLYPAAAVLVGWFLDCAMREGTLQRIRVPLGVEVAGLAAIVLGLHFWAEGRYPQYQADLWVAEWLCIMLGTGITTALALAGRAPSLRPGLSAILPVVFVAGTMLLFMLVAVVVVGPRVEQHRPVRPLVAKALGPLRQADRVACYEEDTYGVAYYADCSVERLRTSSQLRALFMSPQRVVVVMPRSRLPELAGAEGVRVEASEQDAVVVSGGQR